MVVAAAASSMVAGAMPRTVGSSPSSSWASTLAVPTTSRASRAHAYASSFVPRAPPMTATDDGPPSASAALSRPAAASMAAPQLVGTRSSPWRASGAVSRSGEATASKAKRPLSHSQPQLTGSLSTPW